MTRNGLPTIEHAGQLEDLAYTPAHVVPEHAPTDPLGRVSCCFCGVGDSGAVVSEAGGDTGVPELAAGPGSLATHLHGQAQTVPVTLAESGTEGLIRLDAATTRELTPPGGVLAGQLTAGDVKREIAAREVSRDVGPDGRLRSQSFHLYKQAIAVTKSSIKHTLPTAGCVKLKLSQNRQPAAFPIHVAPSVKTDDGRHAITYREAISQLATLLLEHRRGGGNTLLYCSGQLDYLAIFAIQEVCRLLGIRNLTGNAEHCLNAGAVHNEILTGQEGPFLTIAQGTDGPGRFYLFNGWNGFITHPPAFNAILQRPDFDGFLIEVQVTESAKAVAKKLGPERVLLVKPRSDPHIALAVAHELLRSHPGALEQRFLQQFSDAGSYAKFCTMAGSPRFAPENVAERCAPEPEYVERLHLGIRTIAAKLAQPGVVPINIPSVGLSQTSGVVAHCLWGSAMAMVGKYGLNADGSPAGGTLRIPGQINAESEVQGLSRKYFMGRIPIDHRGEAARRMGLPEDAYEAVAEDNPRAALDYSDPTPDAKELFVCMGTQFESNMMDRRRMLRKLEDPNTKLVVIDPIADPFTVDHADLILPSPPHIACTKVYQNGEWKLSVSVPQKKAAPETRSDATILYDVMAEIVERLEADASLRAEHDDIARHLESGYLRGRFCPPKDGRPGLARPDGEVSRPELWRRVMAYMQSGSGPLYCLPAHADGRPIEWAELLAAGSVVYGGVGTHRFRLDYDDPNAAPFRDIYCRPSKFKFFTPTEADLKMPTGIILNSGRSTLSDDRTRVRYATSTFNSGKATPIVDMPDDNPLYVSPALAGRLGLKDGGWAKITSRFSGQHELFPVVVSDRVKGETTYISFHKCRAEIDQGRYVNSVTAHESRCAYSGQTTVKATQILLEPAATPDIAEDTITSIEPVITRPDTTKLDTSLEMPVWEGQNTQLYVTEIIPETHDSYTFRFQGDPLCRFVYYPGQFCTLVLDIDGKKVVRSYTISSTPSRPYSLEITVKRVPGGLVSNWLPDNLRVGSKVEISGPRGKFRMEPGKVPPKVLLLGAGSGVTPAMSMARWLCDVAADVDINFFNSVRSPNDIIFEKEIEMMTQRFKLFSASNVTSTRESSKAWTGLSGRVSRKMFELLVPDLHEREVFMCGPEGYMEAVKGILRDLDFNMSKLHLESFGGVRTSKDKPAPVGTTAESSEAAATGDLDVQFARSGKSVKSSSSAVLLDIAEENDVEIGYACRMGSCGECKAKVLEGDVDMESDDGLEEADKKQGYVLTCVAKPKTNVVLDV